MLLLEYVIYIISNVISWDSTIMCFLDNVLKAGASITVSH